MVTTKLAKSPSNFLSRPDRKSVAKPAAIINNDLAIPITAISCFEGVSKTHLRNRCTIKVLHLPFPYSWCFSFLPFSLREIMWGNYGYILPSSLCWGIQTPRSFLSLHQAVIAYPHEPKGQLCHIIRVPRTIGSLRKRLCWKNK